MSKLFTIQEIAEKFGVTHMAVRLWIKKGLPFQKEKIIGTKTRMIVDPKDVVEFHKIKEK